MTTPRVHTLDATQEPEKEPAFLDASPVTLDHPALRDDEPAASMDWLDQMEAERAEMVRTTVAYRTFWPTWNKNLVVVFHPLDSGKYERLVAAVRAQDGGKREKNRALIVGLLAEAAVSLHYKGRLVDDGRGFGPNMARVLQAPQGASIGQLAWLALKGDDTVLGPFAAKVQKWMEDPEPKDETRDADDPFVDDSATQDGLAS